MTSLNTLDFIFFKNNGKITQYVSIGNNNKNARSPIDFISLDDDATLFLFLNEFA